MNSSSGDLNLFNFFYIIKKNFLKILILPLIFSVIFYFILTLYDNNFSKSSDKIQLIIYENNFLKNNEIYNYNILLSLSFQDIIAYQTIDEANSAILRSIVNEKLIIGFDANKLLNSLTLIDNRNIYFLSNSLLNKTRFIKYLDQKIDDEKKLSRIKNFLASIEILKIADTNDTSDKSIDKQLIISAEINGTENFLKASKEFLFEFEQYLKNNLLEDFNQYTSYYSLIINNELQNTEKYSINKEIQIKKLKDRIEILKENRNIAENLENNDKEKKLDLIWDMTVSSKSFDFATIDYTDFPLYVFGSDFLNAEISRIELNILRLLKDNYTVEENEIALSKKYLSDLKLNFYKIKYLNDNLSFFNFDINNVNNIKKIADINYIIIFYIFSMLLLIFYYVLNFIYLSNQNK